MENTTQTFGKLFEALSKAQAIMESAKKDASNPFFKSKYADLESVWQACRKPLTDNGLSVLQTIEQIQDKTCLVTVLGHSSGEWIRSVLPLPIMKQDAQSMGSAITYCRRYALAAMVGICQTDDDGEAAMKDVRQGPKQSEKVVTLTEEQVNMIKLHPGADEERIAKLLTRYQASTLKDIPSTDLDRIIQYLDTKPKGAQKRATA